MNIIIGYIKQCQYEVLTAISLEHEPVEIDVKSGVRSMIWYYSLNKSTSTRAFPRNGDLQFLVFSSSLSAKPSLQDPQTGTKDPKARDLSNQIGTSK